MLIKASLIMSCHYLTYTVYLYINMKYKYAVNEDVVEKNFLMASKMDSCFKMRKLQHSSCGQHIGKHKQVLQNFLICTEWDRCSFSCMSTSRTQMRTSIVTVATIL